jgi:3D (Asp-Asp-Asp) domain-containing protein
MATILRLTLIACFAFVLTSCVTTTERTRVTASKPSTVAPGGRYQTVRTTAYTHNEGGSGVKNAIGRRLAGGNCKSAASDWSRYPLGTRFRVVRTGQEYVIDDYGGALIGTNTIDLYKPSRAEVHRWGVRSVDIEILQWGSRDESLKVLRPRHRARIVRRMIAGLETRKTS